MSELVARWSEDKEEIARHTGIAYGWWLGGDPSNPTWDEYLACLSDEAQAVVKAVREACERDNLDLYGEDMNDGKFVLSDGSTFGLSWRAWGDFRQAMEGKREGYMRYYMR